MMIATDKVAHFGLGAVLGLSGLWLGWQGILPVLMFAACKEAWDYKHPPHCAELLDFVATGAGGLFTLTAILLHERFP